MKKILVLFLFILSLTACTKTTSITVNNNDFLSYDENHVFDIDTYYLDLYLDDSEKELRVDGKLIYLVKEELDTLNIRMYPRERNLTGFDLEYVKVDGELTEASFDPINVSLLSIPLESTKKVGDIIEIDFSYIFDYWRGKGRISYYDEYYITMFFYPFVQLDNTGDISDYNYAFNGESYYNSIGDYYVSINTPKDYIVASSGKEIDTSSTFSRRTTDFYLEDGRDFSFSASKDYIVYEHIEQGITYTIYSIRDLSTEEQEDTFETLYGSMKTYSDAIGDYGKDYLNLELGYIYGMESSGIIYCSEEISHYTIVHEVIHQWIYSIIHSDQAREPFLDESLTTYITFLYFYEAFGLEHATGYLDSRSSLKEGFEDYYNLYEGRSLLESIHDYQTGYAYIIYYHGPTLYRYYFEDILGNDYDVLEDFLQELYKEYAYKELTTTELLELLEDITNTPGSKDWFLEEAESLKIPEPLE